MMMRQLMMAAGLAVAMSAGTAFGGAMTLATPAAGDAVYHWNTRYGNEWYYSTGGTTMNATLQNNSPYGNDYWVSIWEVPIATLAGHTLTSATLKVDCLGCDTWFYLGYGSVRIGWLDTGTRALTGDIVADGMGPAATGVPAHFTIYDTYSLACPAQVISLDVLTMVQADLAAGRTYSSFVMSASRDTGGTLYTAESGRGPVIVVTSDTIPEPASIALLGLGAMAMIRRRRAA